MDSSQKLQEGLSHHQAGRLREAELVYRNILSANPRDADALYLLGTLAGQCGKLDAAIDLIQQAIAARPLHQQALRNLGSLFAQAGRFEESISTYRKALQQWPDHAEIHNDFGSVLLRHGDFDEAASAFSTAITLKPGFADAHNNLANSLRKKGSFQEALAAASRAVELKPAWAEAHFEKAQNLSALGRPEEALAEYRTAAGLKPAFEEAHTNIGRVLADMGRLDEAIAIYTEAARAKPDDAMAHASLGHALYTADRLAEAVSAFQKAAQLKPDYLSAHANLAMALGRMQRFDEALAAHALAARLAPEASMTHESLGEIMLQKLDAASALKHFQRAVEIDPNRVEPLLRMAAALQSLGRFDEAAECLRRGLKLRPDLARSYKSLIGTGRGIAGDAEISQLTAILQRPNVSMEDRIASHFALGKALDELNRFDEAFAHYAQANSLVKKQCASVGDVFDPSYLHRGMDDIIRTFTPRFFEERRGWGNPSDVPVFVVGMPRSGTTLVHQIAASHPKVHGAGERTDISNIAKTLLGEQTGSTPATIKADEVRNAADQYIEHLRSLDPTAARIVDKQPLNVIHVGLISLLLPQARIIFCNRDPRDTCLSCYFQDFARSNLFSFDLAGCGHQQVEMDRIARHWKRVLPLKMLEVQYEAVVDDLEGQARRLIDFLGLPWDPACLDFHRAETAVMTASVWQVRQPIYRHSVGRWRHYEKHLGPLFEVLKAMKNSD